MSCIEGVNNVINSPVNAVWRIEAEESIDFAGLSDPDGLEFNLFKVDGTKIRFVFNLDAGSVIPSAGAGEVVIEIPVTTGDSAEDIASAFQTAADADADLTAVVDAVDLSVVTVKRVAVGRVNAPVDVDSQVKIVVCRTGQNLALGLLNEPPEVATETNVFDIVAEQSGDTILGQLVQGTNVSVSLSLLETPFSVVKELYGIYGTNSFTPGSGTEVAGVGSGSVGKSLLREAARLELLPVNVVDDNLSYAVNLMLSVPVPSSISFAGNEPRTLTVDFTGYANRDLANSNVNQLLFGDATQTGL